MTQGWGYSLAGRCQVSRGPLGHEGLGRGSVAGLLPGASRAQAVRLETAVRSLRLGAAPQRKGASFLWEPQAPPAWRPHHFPWAPQGSICTSECASGGRDVGLVPLKWATHGDLAFGPQNQKARRHGAASGKEPGVWAGGLCCGGSSPAGTRPHPKWPVSPGAHSALSRPETSGFLWQRGLGCLTCPRPSAEGIWLFHLRDVLRAGGRATSSPSRPHEQARFLPAQCGSPSPFTLAVGPHTSSSTSLCLSFLIGETGTLLVSTF